MPRNGLEWLDPSSQWAGQQQWSTFRVTKGKDVPVLN
jgi:hypothetical protein